MPTPTETNLNLNLTSSSGMAPLMEATINRYVLKNNETERKYTKFGQSVTIPKGKTKTITFDKMSPLPKAVVPLTEGITPRGAQVHISRLTAEPSQYGNYVSYSDELDFYANDPSPQVLHYTKALSDNQIETYEHLDAMELASGLNVFYADGVESRAELTRGLMLKDIKKAVTQLKVNKVKPCAGKDYICFIHPEKAADLFDDPDWQKPHQYQDTANIYNGEIGRYFGVRFIEDPDQYVFRGDYFLGKYPELNIIKVDKAAKKLYVAEDIASGEASRITGAVWINGKSFTIASCTAGVNGAAYVTLTETLTNELIERDMVIYPGGGGVGGAPVYGTIIVGENAYGTAGDTDIEMINKGLGSAGSADPLNQRGTYAWKGHRFFKILEQTKICRVESL